MTISNRSYLLRSGTNDTFVRAIYEEFLGRFADESGASFWVAALTQGMSRESVITNFLQSAEYLEQNTDAISYISSLYEHLLQRAPDARGLKYWTRSLNNHIPQTVIAKAFIGSSEFSNHTDNGTAGLLFSRDAAGSQIISPTEIFNVIEGDAQSIQQFYVQLNNAPTRDVTLYLETSDLDAGLLQLSGHDGQSSRIDLKFTPENWATAQAFKVFAGNDGVANQGQSWKVFALTNSQDGSYDYYRPNKSGEAIAIAAKNINQAGVDIYELDFDLLSSGKSGSLGVVLTSKPTADVYLYVHGLGGNFNINGAPAFQEHVLKFTPENWDTQQKAVLQYANPLFDAKSIRDGIVVDIKSADASYNDLANKNYDFPIINHFLTPALSQSINPNLPSNIQGAINISQTHVSDSEINASIVSMLKDAGTFIGFNIEGTNIPFLGDLKGRTTSVVTSIQNAIDKVIAGSDTTVADDEFQYDPTTKTFTLKLNETISIFNASLARNLGFSGLDFLVDGNIGAEIDYKLTINGGWNALDGVFIDQTATKFNGNINLSGKGLKVEGLIGPLSMVATDTITLNIAKTRQNTGGNISIDLGLKKDADGKLTINEAKDIVTGITALKNAIDLSISGDAQLSLSVKTQTNLPAEYGGSVVKYLPTYSFDLTAPVSFNYKPLEKNTDGSAFSAQYEKIYFDNVKLKIPEFINNVIQPIVEQANKALTPFYPYVNYMLKGEPAWDVSKAGASLAAEVSEPIKNVLLVGDDVGGVVYNAISGISKVVNKAYQETFKLLDGLSAYNQVTPYIKDNLISPLELVRSAANLYYNLSFDGDNTIAGILASTGAGMRASGISEAIIQVSNGALKSKLDVFNGDKSNQDNSVRIKTAVDALDEALRTIQKIEKLSKDVSAFKADGVIKFDNFSITGNEDLIFASAQTNEFSSATYSETIGSNASFDSIISDLKELGFDFPILTQANGNLENALGIVRSTTMGRDQDIITFTPDIPTMKSPELKIPFGLLQSFGIPTTVTDNLGVNLDLVLSASASLDANLSFGVDTYGATQWLKGITNPRNPEDKINTTYKFLDGFYIKDGPKAEFIFGLDTKIALEGGLNTPDFTVADIGVEKGLMNADAAIYLRADTTVGLDLKDSGTVSGKSDGKVRPSELINFVKNAELPFDISTALDLYGGYTFKGNFDASKLPGWDETQEWASFSIGDGQPNEIKLVGFGDNTLLAA